MVYALGVDVGGTKVAAAILDEDGHFIERVEFPSDTTDEENMFKQVVSCIDNVVGSSDISYEDICAMGIGVPGKIDRARGVAVFQNNLPWHGFPVVERLKQVIPIDRVVLDNDV